MNDEISKEDSLIEYPCMFPIKAMGKQREGFDLLILSLVARHVEDITPDALKIQESSNNRFVSITVTFEAQSREQLDAVYRELTAHEEILMVL